MRINLLKEHHQLNQRVPMATTKNHTAGKPPKQGSNLETIKYCGGISNRDENKKRKIHKSTHTPSMKSPRLRPASSIQHPASSHSGRCQACPRHGFQSRRQLAANSAPKEKAGRTTNPQHGMSNDYASQQATTLRRPRALILEQTPRDSHLDCQFPGGAKHRHKRGERGEGRATEIRRHLRSSTLSIHMAIKKKKRGLSSAKL